MRETEQRSHPRAKAMRREMTRAELVLWTALRDANGHGYKFRRQHPIGNFIADFVHVRGRLVIEVDGDTHGTEAERTYDARRTAMLRAQGWDVLRFTNTAIYENVSGVVDGILARLPPHPNVAPRRSTSPAGGRG